MSPALQDAATIAAMQKALQNVANVESRSHRAAAYIAAGFADRDILRHDSDALRTELIRRRLLAGDAKTEQSA